MIIDSQKAIYDKVGLGYNTLKKQKFLKNIFVNISIRKLSNITCFKCGKVGHKVYSCLSNKFDDRNVKTIWVSKETIMTNSKGPKLAWVPQVKT